MMNFVFFRTARRLAVLAVLAALAIPCLAATAPPAWAGERLLNGKGVLWKVERDGVAPSWVLGTMHVSDRRVTSLRQPLVEVLTTVDSLSLELIFNDRLIDGDDAWLLPEGRRLRDIVGKRLFGRLAERMARFGVGERRLDRLKPWVAANFLGPLSPEPARRDAGMIFLDHLLQYIAAERGARVFALETPKDQLDAFDGMPMRLQVDMLRHAVRRSGRTKRTFERMVELYLESDVEAILSLAVGDSVRIPEFARVLNTRVLDHRNRKMVERMMPRLTEGNALVAIGAGHLPGQSGILNLLAERGYRVARVY